MPFNKKISTRANFIRVISLCNSKWHAYLAVTFCCLNILKSPCWNFFNPCKHIHINKTNTFNKKNKCQGQILTFSNNFFQKILSGTVWTQIRTHMLDLIWVQTVRKKISPDIKSSHSFSLSKIYNFHIHLSCIDCTLMNHCTQTA